MLRKYKQRSERYVLSDSLATRRSASSLNAKSSHRVAEGKVYALDDKVKVMLDYKAPTSITELRSCLGLFSYYRRFIKDFAAIAAPLHALTKQERTVANHSANLRKKPRQRGVMVFGQKNTRRRVKH